MLLISKDDKLYYKDCYEQNEIEIINNFHLDQYIIIEEGVTLRNIINIINKYDLLSYCFLDINFIKKHSIKRDDFKVNDNFEYISIIQHYTYNVRNNKSISIEYNNTFASIETFDSGIEIIMDYYLLDDRVLDLEIRIERNYFEYNDTIIFSPFDNIKFIDFLSILQNSVYSVSTAPALPDKEESRGSGK